MPSHYLKKNAGLILTGPLGPYLSEIVIKAIFIQEKSIGNVVCKTEAILSQIIASVRGSIQRLMIHEREVIYLVLRRNLQAMLRFQ